MGVLTKSDIFGQILALVRASHIVRISNSDIGCTEESVRITGRWQSVIKYLSVSWVMGSRGGRW